MAKEEYGPIVTVSARGTVTETAADTEQVEQDRRNAIPFRKERKKRVMEAVTKAIIENDVKNQQMQTTLLMINNKRLNRIPLSQDELLMEQRAMVAMDRIAALNLRAERVLAAIEADIPCDPHTGSIEGEGNWQTDDRTPDV